jgi:hypothetical protein
VIHRQLASAGSVLSERKEKIFLGDSVGFGVFRGKWVVNGVFAGTKWERWGGLGRKWA